VVGYLTFLKMGNKEYKLNFNSSTKKAYFKNISYGPTKFGDANWNGRDLKYGAYNVGMNLYQKQGLYIKYPNEKTLSKLNVTMGTNGKPSITLAKLPKSFARDVKTWRDIMKGLPPRKLGDVDWTGDDLVYKGERVKMTKLPPFKYMTQSGMPFEVETGTADGYPFFKVGKANSNMPGFYKEGLNYISLSNNSIKYVNFKKTYDGKKIYQLSSSNARQSEWYLKNSKKFVRIYKLANGKWSMAAPPGQSGAPPPPPPPPNSGPPVNYKTMTLEQLIKARNNKGTPNANLNAALNAAVNKQLRSVNGSNRPRKFGVYGDILIKMGSSRNYPGRSKVRDAIISELRRALQNIRDPRRAKIELERAKGDVRLSSIPIKNSNVKRAFDTEETNIKKRLRDYNDEYGGYGRSNNENSRYGRRPPRFPVPRMPPPGFNMGPEFPRNNRAFRAPEPATTFRLPSNAPQAPRMPNMGAPALPPPPINLTGGGNQQPFAPSPMAPPPTNQSLLANLPSNERAAINAAGGVNKAANLVNQAGGGTNVAAAANALAQTGGNVNRAIAEKGANEKAVKVVIQLGGGKNLNNIERAKNVLNGLNNVAVQLKRRKRRSKPKAKGKGVAKGRVAKAKPKVKTRVVYRTRPGDRVRTAELNKLLHIATKDEIKKRMENANLLNKVYTRAELEGIYKKYVLGKNLPPLKKKKRVLKSRAK
jgi:ribosome-associated translation inhibitor RaiA